MAKLMMAEFDRQQNKLEDANKLITEVIEQDPKNADALALRATGKIEKNDLSGAVSDLREALDQKPDSVQIRVILARAYERQGAIELARDEFSQVLKDSGFNPEIAMQYIDMLRRRGSYDAMELVLEEAINRNPSNIMLVTTLAELRLNKGDWNGAEAIANALLKLDANSEVGKRIKAGVQLGKKQFDESIDTLKQAIDPAKPVSGSAMAALVTTYLQAGKVKEAEDFVNATLAANPESVDALMLLGNIRYAQRRSSEAEAQYRKVIELRPKLASGYFSLARMFASEKRSDEAIEILKKGREAAPIDLGSSLLLASIYEIRGSVEEAIKIYEEQLVATPDVLVVVNNLASLLADFRSEPESQERAQALARRLESIDVPQFKDTVGWVAYLKGDLRTAQVNLQDAVKRLPEVAAVRYHLGMTLAGMKRNDEAKAELQKASELAGPDDPLNKKIDEALKTLQTAAVAP
jgi:tetratricopeptide (TPR) repeat protein